jgi:hypothetical protein
VGAMERANTDKTAVLSQDLDFTGSDLTRSNGK